LVAVDVEHNEVAFSSNATYYIALEKIMYSM